jgi:RNA polymerase sigma-70 factor, ECF subfamily
MFRSYKSKSDEQLMVLVASNNADAFTELYNRYNAKLLRYFHRMLWNDRQLAEDLLHDLFVKVIEHPAHFKAELKFSTWIYSVANNMCKNQFRRNEYHRAFNETQRAAPVAEESLLEMNEFSDVLCEALLKLDEDDRNLYTLRFEVEMPMEEIALLLECPVGTIKSRSFYLKKKIASLLTWYNKEKIKYG